MKSRLNFIKSLVHNPDILFLDEPTSGVDPLTRREFWNMIYETAERGVTILITTHYMDEAVKADRVIVMDEGKVVLDDVPKKVFSNVSVIKKAGLDVPQVTELIHELNRSGLSLDPCIITEQECYEALKKILKED